MELKLNTSQMGGGLPKAMGSSMVNIKADKPNDESTPFLTRY